MRITLASNTCWSIWRFRAGLISQLIADGHEISVLAPADDFTERVIKLGCSFTPTPIRANRADLLRDIGLLLTYLRYIGVTTPDLIVCYTAKPNIYFGIAGRLRGIPVVNVITGLGIAFSGSPLLKFVVERLYRVALRRAYRVFFLNDSDREHFVERKILHTSLTSVVLPGEGINTSYYDRRLVSTESRDQRRMQFIYVGRILREKGVLDYIAAARKVLKVNPEARFFLLGPIDSNNPDAITVDEISSWVDEGTVEYLRGVDDVRDLVANSGCVVLPSYREGLPRSLLEASALEVPIIASDVPGCRDVVEDGTTGLLFKVGDVQDLAQKMIEIGTTTVERRAQMGDAGRRLVSRRFSEQAVMRHYDKAIVDLPTRQ